MTIYDNDSILGKIDSFVSINEKYKKLYDYL